jgi:hypothetical protein
MGASLMAKALRSDRGSFVSLLEVPPGADLVAELRAVNTNHDGGRGRFWQITVEEDDFGEDWGGIGPAVWLNAGTAGSTGALCWVACGVHSALQVPIELVFEAVAEVVATRQRPTCVDWVEVDEIEHTLIGG